MVPFLGFACLSNASAPHQKDTPPLPLSTPNHTMPLGITLRHVLLVQGLYQRHATGARDSVVFSRFSGF